MTKETHIDDGDNKEEINAIVSISCLALPPASSEFLLVEYSSSSESSSFIENVIENVAENQGAADEEQVRNINGGKRKSDEKSHETKNKLMRPVKSLIAAAALALTCSTTLSICVLANDDIREAFISALGIDDEDENDGSDGLFNSTGKSVISEALDVAVVEAEKIVASEDLTPALINKIPSALNENTEKVTIKDVSGDDVIMTIDGDELTGDFDDTTNVLVESSDTVMIVEKGTASTLSTEPYAFSLYECIDNPNPTEVQLTSLKSALSSLSPYDVSMAFIDLDTKCGYAYAIDDEIYGASSFKGPMGAYVLSRVAETSGISSSEKSSIKAAIECSDNDAYQHLIRSYRKTSDFASWLKELDIKSSLFSRGDFATYSARDALKVWNYINDYINGKTSDGDKWSSTLESHLLNTNVSFTRDGVENQLLDEEDVQILIGQDGKQYAISVAQDVEVLNKAGWYEGGGNTYNSTTDNALIRYNGKTYLMCILTSAPATASNQKKVSKLAATLWSMRETLAPEKGEQDEF